MKVLVVHNQYRNPGGGEVVVYNQEQELLRRAGHDVSTWERSNRELANYRGLARLKMLSNAAWSRDTYTRFREVLRREKPDVVHVHNTLVMISPSVYGASQDSGVPVVQTLHNYRYLCPAATFFREGHVCKECVEHGPWRGVMHACYQESRANTAAIALMILENRRRRTFTTKVDRYIALTRFSRRQMIEGGFPADRISVKPNFVYPDPGAGGERDDYAVFVGRLSTEKGVDHLISAWERLKAAVPLRILGFGPEQERLKAQAACAGLCHIRFEGQVPREDVWRALRGARFLVFPSVWYENFPITIAEAFACATPVLCSRLGSMAEIVTDRRTGLHFNPGDPADLAEKVEWAWGRPNVMVDLGREARQEFEQRYTAEANYPQLLSIYKQATNNARSQIS